MVCVGDVKTMTRSGKTVHAKCYDRLIEILGFARENLEFGVGWKHKNFWALNWFKEETPPKVGETITNTYGRTFKVLYVKRDFVVLEHLKKKNEI